MRTQDFAEFTDRNPICARSITAPDAPAIIMGSGAVLSHRALEGESSRLAQRLYDAGLRFGDHIALLMENRVEFPIAVWAAQRSGLILTPVNWHLAPEEAAYVVNNCQARVVISSDELAELLAKIRPLTPSVERWLLAGHEKEIGTLGGEPLATSTWTSELTYEPLEGMPLCYSSGTSGKPKGILRQQPRDEFGYVTARERQLIEQNGFSERTVYLNPAPLYHTAPFHWTRSVVRAGGTVVIMEKFDAEQCLALIDRYRVTDAQFVPTMFTRMLKLPDAARNKYGLSSLRRAIHAAAPCPVEIKERMIAWWGPVLFEYYAGTEGGWVQIESDEWLQHKGSVGKSPSVHVLDDHFNELPVGEIGAVYLEAEVPFEYLGDQQKTAETFSPQGWFTLGEMGYLDADGYLYLTDRKSNMIVSGGVNIYPQEVENVLITHPAVIDVAVIGVPNEDFGEEVKAVVELESGVTPSPNLARELIDFCRARIASFKCPRSVDFTESLPRLPSGKLLKRDLRAKYWR